MNKPHAHIYSAEISKRIAGTLKLPTYLWPQSPHGAVQTMYYYYYYYFRVTATFPGERGSAGSPLLVWPDGATVRTLDSQLKRSRFDSGHSAFRSQP